MRFHLVGAVHAGGIGRPLRHVLQQPLFYECGRACGTASRSPGAQPYTALKAGNPPSGRAGGTMDHRRIDEAPLRPGVAARHPLNGSCAPVTHFLPGRELRTLRRTAAWGWVGWSRATEDSRQPLDPARQSFCDAGELFRRCTLRGLLRPPIHRLTGLRIKLPVRHAVCRDG